MTQNYLDQYLTQKMNGTPESEEVGEPQEAQCDFNYFKFQYFFFNRSLLQNQLLKCMLIQWLDLLPHLMILLFGFVYMNAFSFVYLFFAVGMLHKRTNKVIKYFFYFFLIFQRLLVFDNIDVL